MPLFFSATGNFIFKHLIQTGLYITQQQRVSHFGHRLILHCQFHHRITSRQGDKTLQVVQGLHIGVADNTDAFFFLAKRNPVTHLFMTKAGLFTEFFSPGFTDIFLHKLRNLGARGAEEEFGIQQVKQRRRRFRAVNFFQLCEALEAQDKTAAKLTRLRNNSWQSR